MKILPNGKGFLDVETSSIPSYHDSKAIIVPFGLEFTTSYKHGTKFGPRAILNASQYIELYDQQFQIEPYKKIGIACLEEVLVSDTMSSSLELISDVISKIIKNNKIPITLGGEHTLIAGTINPFAKMYEEIIIIHFDAHTDLRNEYHREKFSHACALRRCLDFDNTKVISFGVRSTSQSEMNFYKQNKDRIKICWAEDKDNWDVFNIIKNIKDKNIYITFDVDVLDSSLIPSTGTPEPGGLFWNEAIDLIDLITKSCNVVGLDVCELSPIVGFHSCDFMIAKLVYKIISLCFLNKKPR